MICINYMRKSYRIAKEYNRSTEANIKEFHEALHSTKDFLGIVSGVLNPHVFNRKEVLEDINYFLNNKGTFYLLFNGNKKPWFKNKNTGLAKIISKFQDKVKISSLPFLPNMQYLVTDNTVLHQEGSQPIFPSFSEDLYVYKNNTKNAYEWQKSLKKMQNIFLEPISF